MKTMNDTDNEAMTVANLRRKGFQVRINHLRRVKNEKGTLATKYEIGDRNLIDPHGGATEAEVTTPEGTVVKAVVNVWWKDSYCRKTGINEVLKRAMEQLHSFSLSTF